MTVDEMIDLKKKYGFSYEQIAERAGMPLSTVQKVLGGITSSPRHSTLQCLSKAFVGVGGPKVVRESTVNYGGTGGSSAHSGIYEGNNTLADYLALPDDVRAELIDGVFYEMASPSFVHQKIGLSIFATLEQYVRVNEGKCEVMAAPLDVQLDCDDTTVVQPDVFVICDRSKITRAGVVGAPDLVVEVLSESRWYNDMVRKLRKYKNAGVREYWIVMPEKKTVLVYDFDNGGVPVTYTFEDKIPVNIWGGECGVDFEDIYERVAYIM